jgi:hypothetical protein
MTPYILFMYDAYYPGGGSSDEKGRFDTLEEARVFAESPENAMDCYEILDLQTGEWK